MQQLVTQTEFAVIYGNATRGEPVTKQAVGKLIKRYNIPKHQGTKIDPQEAMRIIADQSNPARRSAIAGFVLGGNYAYAAPAKPLADESPAESDDEEEAEASNRDNFAEFRTQREKANAQLAELQLRERMGQLLERSAVERQTATIFRELRDKVLAAPYRLAGRLVTLATEREVVACIEEAVNAIFAEFAEKLAAEAGSHAG
ncbi:hypothetical protein [Paludisphaera rhizosphaerae]|nr:hypothetical protein [Paludisphaera rhizosphaerae]